MIVILAVLFSILPAVMAYAATHFKPTPQTLALQSPLDQTVARFTAFARLTRPFNHGTPANVNLPFDVRTITLDGGEYLEAWYVPHEQSRGLVIMFAGYGGSREALLTPASYLYQFGYSSLMVDFRGSGGSSGDNTTLGIREAEDVVAAFTYATGQWPEQPLLGYGVSMGSAALMRAVALYELKPRALILEGPFDRLDTTVKHRFEQLGPLAGPLSKLLVFWGGLEFGTNAFRHNPVEYATKISCPTLYMRGEHDPWIWPEEIDAIVAATPTQAKLLTAPGLGHQMPFVIGVPELWSDAVRNLLNESGT